MADANVNLPPKVIASLLEIKNRIGLPSAEDLDAVAVEQEIKAATMRKESRQVMRGARARGMGYQRFRADEMRRMARA